MTHLRYHITVTSALQTVARLVRSSPSVAVIRAPIEKALQVAQRQVQRYPTITATHITRTALRKAKIPAVHLVVMPPDQQAVTMLLLSNLVPVGSREVWGEALGPVDPLTWRNYELVRLSDGRITWRLSQAAREHYQSRLARLITGRGGRPEQGERLYQLPPETAHAQVLALAAHLQHYPGLSGIRRDVFDLAQYSTKLWKSTHAQGHYPVWPTLPYLRFGSPQTAPLTALSHHPVQETDHAQKEQ